MNLYIARHGQTEENVQRILQGQMPGHLTAEGIGQAEQLRDMLRDVPFQRIITSDLQRAVNTARIIAQPHGIEPELEPLLRERDFGIHTGGPYIKISHALDPSAETMEQLAQRAADFLNKTAALAPSPCPLRPALPLDSSKAPSPILVVSHGLFLRVLQAVYRGVSVRSVEKMENAEYRILPLSPDMHFAPVLVEETGGAAN